MSCSAEICSLSSVKDVEDSNSLSCMRVPLSSSDFDSEDSSSDDSAPDGPMTQTTNGALAFQDVGSDLLFVYANSLRGGFATIQEHFRRVLRDEKLKPYALVLMFHVRDARNGKGERELFRQLFAMVAEEDPILAEQLLSFVPKFGYWKDLVQMYCSLVGKDSILSSKIVELCAEQLRVDLAGLASGQHDLSLVSKWLPRENNAKKNSLHHAHRKMIKDICVHLGWMNERRHDFKKYRQSLASICGAKGAFPTIESIFAGIGDGSLTMEDALRLFNSEKIPSIAVFRLRNALKCVKKDGTERDHLNCKEIRQRLAEIHKAFLADCVKGTKLIKAKVAQPTDISSSLVRSFDETIEAQMTALLANIRESAAANPGVFSPATAMALIDVSGSMSTQISDTSNSTCLDIAVFLGYILSQLSSPPYQHKVITFSEHPMFINVEETESHYEAFQKIIGGQWDMNTNIEKAFELILDTAILHQVPPEKMVKTLFVFSDMQFDQADRRMAKNQTIHEGVKARFAAKGYELPLIVYWNLNANSALPVNATTPGTLLMSGFSQNLFTAFVDGTLASFTPEDPPTPEEIMYKVLQSEPYEELRQFLTTLFGNFAEEN